MKTLRAFEFKQAAEAFKAKYPWDKILDGDIHQLEEGTDYTAKTATFRTLAATQAKKRGMGVRINAVEGGLVIQAFERPTDTTTETETPLTTKKGRKAGKQS